MEIPSANGGRYNKRCMQFAECGQRHYVQVQMSREFQVFQDICSTKHNVTGNQQIGLYYLWLSPSMAIRVRKQCWNHGSTNTIYSGWHALSQTLQFCKSLANCTSDIKNCLSSSGVTSSLRSWKFSSSHHYPYTLNIHYIGQSRGLHHSPYVTFLINVLCSLNCTLLLKDRCQTSSYSNWNVDNQAWALDSCGHRRVHRSGTW